MFWNQTRIKHGKNSVKDVNSVKTHVLCLQRLVVLEGCDLLDCEPDTPVENRHQILMFSDYIFQ